MKMKLSVFKEKSIFSSLKLNSYVKINHNAENIIYKKFHFTLIAKTNTKKNFKFFNIQKFIFNFNFMQTSF